MLSSEKWWDALIVLIVSIIKSPKVMQIKLNKQIFNIKNDAVFATSSLEGIPNIVPIHSKHLISSKKVLISDQFMKKTKENIINNPFVALTIIDGEVLYKISGSCSYKSSGFLYMMAVRGAKKYAKKHAKDKNIKINCKGIVIMKIKKIERGVV